MTTVHKTVIKDYNKGCICCKCRKSINLKNKVCIGCGHSNLYISIREVVLKTSPDGIDILKKAVENLLTQISKHNSLDSVFKKIDQNYIIWWLTNKVDTDDHEGLKITIKKILRRFDEDEDEDEDEDCNDESTIVLNI